MPELSRPAAPPSCVADYVTATDPSASSEVTERLDPRESLVAQGSTIATGAAPDLTVADSVKGVITVVAGVCPPAGRAPTPPRRMHKRRVHPDGSVGGAARTREHKEPRAPDPNRKHKPQSVHVQPRRTDSADCGRRKLGNERTGQGRTRSGRHGRRWPRVRHGTAGVGTRLWTEFASLTLLRCLAGLPSGLILAPTGRYIELTYEPDKKVISGVNPDRPGFEKAQRRPSIVSLTGTRIALARIGAPHGRIRSSVAAPVPGEPGARLVADAITSFGAWTTRKGSS